MLTCKVLEAYDLADADICGYLFRMSLGINASEDSSVRMAQDDDLILVKSLAEIIHECINVFFLALDRRKACVTFFDVSVIRSAAAALIPENNGVFVREAVGPDVIKIAGRLAGAAVEG